MLKRVAVYKDHDKKEIDYHGSFHKWGVSYEQSNDGAMGNFSVAIVENAQGEIDLVFAPLIKFIK